MIIEWMVLVLFASNASAHDRDDVRRVIVSVERSSVDIVVVHEITDARRVRSFRALSLRGLSLRGAARMERFGRVAELQALEPRVRQGLAFVVDGRRHELRLEDFRVRDGPLESSGRASLFVMARYAIGFETAAGHTIAVQNLGAIGQVIVEMQLAEGITLERSNLPEREGDPVVGPLVLAAGENAELGFRALSASPSEPRLRSNSPEWSGTDSTATHPSGW